MSETAEISSQVNQEIENRVKAEIFSGEQFKNYPEKYKDKISKILAYHTLKIAGILELDLNEINFGISTPEKVGRNNIDRPALHVEFDGQGNPTFSEVLFSAGEIETHLKLLKMPLMVSLVEQLLAWSVAHELHHLRQLKDNISKVLKSAENFQYASILGEWWRYISDEGETSARVFALKYTADRDIPLHDFIAQNNRLLFVLGQIAWEGYMKVRAILKKESVRETS